MRNSVYRISLEMHDTASQALLNVKKNDSSRQVRISITDSGKPYKIEDGCTAKFRAKKPDGTILYNNCIIENDVIIYDLTNQTSAAAGLVDCEITLYGADFKQITSPRFAIYVDDTLYSDSEVESKDEFTALVTAEKTAVSAAQSAKEAETNANQSALLAEQYKNEAFKVTPAGFTEFVETTNDTLNDIGNLLGNTDISAIGDGTLTGGLDALNSNLNKMFITKTFYPIVGVINGNAVKSITFDVGVEGYTPISFKIISYASAMSDCSICFYNIIDNNATLFFRNNSSNPTPDGATAYCAVNYIKK